MSKSPVVRWEGGYCKLESSHSGTAILRIQKSRTKTTGKREFVVEEIEISRSSIRCIYNALKEFADNERKAVSELPL